MDKIEYDDKAYKKFVEKGIVTPTTYNPKEVVEINGLWNYDIQSGSFCPIFNEERYYLVYIHILPTSIYIGQTKQYPEDRWCNGRGYIDNKLFYINIKKYGWKNIQHIIFKDKLTKNEADKMEMELIHYFSRNEEKTGKTVLNLTYNEM